MRSGTLGLNIIEDKTMVKRKISRVPGGYMGRWLIRQVTYEPDDAMFVNHTTGLIICHPAVAAKLRRAVAEVK